MFNSGGQTYQGGQFLYGGLSNFGQSIGQSIIEARARADKAEQDAGADMVMFNFAKANNLIDPETQTKFLTGNQNVRNGIVAELARKWTMTMAQQRQEADIRELTARANLNIAQAASEFNSNEPDGGPTPRVLPLMTSEGKRLGYSVTLPGSKAMTVLQEPGGGPEQDPATGVWGIRDAKGVFHPFTLNELTAMQLSGANLLGQTVKNASPLDEIISQIANVKGEIALGNRRPGPDWLPFTTPYADQLRALETKRDTLSGDLPAPTPMPTSTASPSPAAARTGQGGYIPGRRYSGKLYLGGDPTDPNNWKMPAQPAAAAAPVSGEPVRVKSVQEAMALPPGTLFIDPNGVTRRTATPAASPADKVRVISPQGQAGYIPAERLRDYLAAGYRQG